MKDIADFFRLLMDSSDWPPRWHCGNWTAFHGWMYIISDLLIWSAYFAIPVVILKYISRKHDAGFIRLYFLFAAFILACGATHFFDAVAFWVPLYRLSALLRLITGIISWITVFYIVKYLPLAVSLRPVKALELEIDDYKYALDQSSIVAITDQKGIIRHVNDNFCRISGYSREELIGQDHRIINSGFHSKAFIRELWVTIANGKIWKGELKNKAKDGSTYWVDTTIVPFLTAEGKPRQYVAIRSDITEQKNAELKLRQSEKIFKTVASSMPGAIIVLLDSECRYQLIEGDLLENLGYRKEDLLGQRAETVLTAEKYAEVKSYNDRVFSGETFSIERRLMGSDTLTRYVPLKDENGLVYTALILLIDITDLKKAQNDIAELNVSLENKVVERTEELALVNKELEAFTYSVSHDLRAPLRIIDGFSDILLTDHADKLDEEGRRTIGIITANARKMGRLIDDLLNLSHLGRQEIVTGRVDMNRLAKMAIDELLLLYVGKEVKIIADPLLPASCDHNLMLQVWINLISNALKYSGKQEQPVIHLSSYLSDNNAVYSVGDNGVGFDIKYVDKLFGVFQRLHKATEFEGTGVGLALVQRIILKHGGRVWAEAEMGKGAVFYFSLPVKQQLNII
jgi:PAS domain S-box-containing protein